MPTQQFVHHHNHTEFSQLDGHTKHVPLFAEAARLGQPAVAMTDHGNAFGAYSFHKASQGTGVKPIIGVEAYMAPSSRYNKRPEFWGPRGGKRDPDDIEGSKDVSGGGKYTHLTLLADGAAGLRNLFRVTSHAYSEGLYGKYPRADLELLAEHSTGIIATTGCPSGEVQTRLRLGQYQEAVDAAARLRDIVGEGNLYVELMDHGLDIERNARDGLLRIARTLRLPLVATNDGHYVRKEDAESHDDLLCVGLGRDKNDPDRFRFSGTGYYLKSADEMYGIDTSDAWQEGCANTLVIAERVGSYDEVFAFRDRTPVFVCPDGHDPLSWMWHELEEGLKKRYPAGTPDAVRQRLNTEMDLIGPLGYASYFLILADIVAWCRSQGIPTGPGRGSAAGALVAYLLFITHLDPLEHGLLFERFLNPDRVSPPDIDLDVSQERRGEVIRYVIGKYGPDYVSMVNTRSMIKAKAALKDTARTLGMPYQLGDELTKLLPASIAGKDVPLACITDPAHPRYHDAEPLRLRYEGDEGVKQVVDTAFGVENRLRGYGVHAAAVLMSREPLIDVVPMRTQKNKDDTTTVCAGFDYPLLEDMGLQKLDLLGIRNLDVMANAVKWIERTRGEHVDLLSLPLDDAETYELVAAGRTLGVFQLDSPQIRQLLRQMHPRRFEDISAVLALYRPGPMGVGAHIKYARRANGREEVEPIHPELADALEPILGETHGVIVYQEQVMAIAQQLAGYTLGQADLLRRAMGKKKKEELDKEEPRFFTGMAGRGFSQEAAQALWDTLLPFADYAFNKSHTAGYGLVSYWTAYLKTHYPAEYMAALLSTVGDNRTKLGLYLADCRSLGLKVLPPDVNDSEATFTPSSRTEIRYGLTAIKGVGAAVVDAVTAGRADGPYRSFPDFLSRVGGKGATKGVVASLAQAGAFDSLGHARRGLLAIHESAVDAAKGLRKKRDVGQGDLFGDAMDAGGLTVDIPADEWDRPELLSREFEMLGRYVSGHPVDRILDALRAHRTATIADMVAGDLPDGARVELAGAITAVERRRSKKSGRPYAKVTLEDLDAAIEVMVFGDVFELTNHRLKRDAIVAIRGRAKVSKEEPVEDENGVMQEGSIEVSVWVDDVAEIDVARAEAKQRRRDARVAEATPITPVGPSVITIRMPVKAVTAEELERLTAILNRYAGDVPVELHLAGARATNNRFALPSRLQVRPCQGLKRELQAAYGVDAVA